MTGRSNRFARAAALAVAEAPARAYNPLFIYGGVGPGQDAPAPRDRPLRGGEPPGARAHVPLGGEFTNEFIERCATAHPLLQATATASMDILLIDDIQSLQGREQTQKEFFHTFNALHDSGKQIVITSDRAPKEIAGPRGPAALPLRDGADHRRAGAGHRDAHRDPQEEGRGRPHVIHDPRGAAVHRRARLHQRAGRRARSPGWRRTAHSGRRIDVELAGEVLEDLFPAPRAP